MKITAQVQVKNRMFIKKKISHHKIKILTDYRKIIMTFQFQWKAAKRKVIKNVLNLMEIIVVIKLNSKTFLIVVMEMKILSQSPTI